jgi:pyruvate formate-lyase/glycerol dehydratase family glycyl radical enzyme
MIDTANNENKVTKGNRILAEALEEINGVNVLTDRVRKQKETFFNTTPRFSAERSRLVTESWKETEGMPVVLRRAKLFQKIMERINTTIWDDELIVGSQTKYLRGGAPFIDYSPTSIIDALRAEKLTIKGEVSDALITEDEKKSLLEDANYWRGKAPGDVLKKLVSEYISEQIDDYIDAHIVSDGPFSVPCAGRNADYNKIMKMGVNGIRQQITGELNKLNMSVWGSQPKYEFLQAGLICCDAIIHFSQRYAKLAHTMAINEHNELRKKELEKIAEICEWVPANPPRTFREALQTFWFMQLANNLEAASSGETAGRLDQYFFPFYEKDLKEGNITRQEAAELLGCLWVKFCQMESVQTVHDKQIGQSSQFQDVTIGGVTRDGKDATNELTFLILEVTRQIKMTQPPVYLRYHKGISDDVLIKAIETNRDHGAGMPAFLNDAPTLIKLIDRGVPLAEARDWVAAGCIAIISSNGSTGDHGGLFNKVKAFELALHNGVEPRSGKQLGLKTGNPRNFKFYDELYNAYLKQLEYLASIFFKVWRMAQQIRSEIYYLPYASILLDDCIEKGEGYIQGGLRYPWLKGDFGDVGHQNVADGLTAIKKLVFENKKITMDDLLNALNLNFEGKEDVRQLLLSAPKYGNDDDYADDIFNQVTNDSLRILAQPDFYGKASYITRGGAAQHYWAGNTISALPDGRKAWEPTADANLSPVQGMDSKGPTAVLLSATKINHQEYAMTTLLNMKIMPTLLRTKEGIRQLLALMKTYFDRGGWHIQFNMIDPEILKDAKQHPEKHRELVVRVAGYSAYFVELSPKVQDEIITRTLHGF